MEVQAGQGSGLRKALGIVVAKIEGRRMYDSGKMRFNLEEISGMDPG